MAGKRNSIKDFDQQRMESALKKKAPKPANGWRYQRGGLARLPHIMACNLAKRAYFIGA
jgi:hypothetical protein